MLQDVNAYYIQQLKQGDREVFGKVYEQYHKPLYYLAMRYLKKESLAEDALQDVFLQLWHYRAQLRDDLPLKGFLFTSMKHHLLNAVRKHKNEILKHTIYMQHQEIGVNDTENAVNYQLSQQLIQQGFNTLPAKKKEILALSFYEGLSNQEIAHKLHLSEHTVRSQLSQSNKLLRAFLEKVIYLMVVFFF